MAELLEKFSYDAPARSGWHIRKNLLERTGYDNQDLLFYDYGQLSCTAGGEKPLDKNTDSSWIILFVRSGNGRIFCNQVCFQLRKNDIFIISPTDRIGARVPPDSTLEVSVLILLDSPAVRMHLSRLYQEKLLHLKEPEAFLPLMRMVEDTCIANLKQPGKTILRELAMQSFGVIAEISRQCLDFESKLTIQQIGTEFSCRPWINWSLPELARKSGLSPRSFERQFRNYYGCSWLQYLTGMKIGMASILLQTTRYPVDEIVSLCNFRSKPYFHQVFKKQTGATPLAYRGNRQNTKKSMLASLFKRTREEKILTANRKKILWLLLQDPRTTLSEIAGKMAIHRSAVQKNLDWLKANHYIRRQGSKRAGYWLILMSDIPKPD
jgi:AraC-like DNA-binding protein